MLLKIYEKPFQRDNAAPDSLEGVRRLYRRLGKEDQLSEIDTCARIASRWRAMTKGRKRPPGLGERIFVLPLVLEARVLQANPDINPSIDHLAYVHAFWHDFSMFRCVEGRCPKCGRS